VRAGEAVSRQCLEPFVNAAEVRETMNKSCQVCARVRVGEHPVSREAAVSCGWGVRAMPWSVDTRQT